MLSPPSVQMRNTTTQKRENVSLLKMIRQGEAHELDMILLIKSFLIFDYVISRLTDVPTMTHQLCQLCACMCVIKHYTLLLVVYNTHTRTHTHQISADFL